MAGKPTVWEMVKQAVDALGGSTTNSAVREWVWDKYPGTNRSTINCQIIAGCVNHPSRVHYAVDRRPRPANNPELDLFFRPAKGRIERYNPARHGKWEIFEDSGALSVREVAEWPLAPPVPVIPSPPVAAIPEPADADVGEVAWMNRLQPLLEAALQSLSFAETRLRVADAERAAFHLDLGQQEAFLAAMAAEVVRRLNRGLAA